MDIKNKNVLVTGASQGLGAAIAKYFAARGNSVLVNCVRGIEKAQTVINEIRSAGGRAEIFQCDISSEEEVAAKFSEIEKTFGPVDILVNNARIDPYMRKPEMSDAEWFDKTIAVNLKGAYLASLALIGGMKSRKWGRIINISSVWAYKPAPLSMMPYSISKAGMHALTRGFAGEGAAFNVTVNTFVPGLIMTENASKRLSEAQLAAETASVPMKRGASPEEMAEIVFNIAGSSFMTGESINANGGAYMGI